MIYRKLLLFKLLYFLSFFGSIGSTYYINVDRDLRNFCFLKEKNGRDLLEKKFLSFDVFFFYDKRALNKCLFFCLYLFI
jgi:hypothetical protein